MIIRMAQQGWQCPNCGNIISPNMMWCPFCSGEKNLTYTTTTTTDFEKYLNMDRETFCEYKDDELVYHKPIETEPQTEGGNNETD